MDELNTILSFPFREHTLVDVGAHIGWFAGLFTSRGWRAVCLEPEPANFAELERNLAGKNATLVNAAAGDKTGWAALHVSPEHWGIHSFKPWHATHTRAIDVRVYALRDLKLGAVGLLKVDVEGAELPVIGGHDFEASRPEMVVVEFCDERTKTHFDYDHHDLAAHLAAFDYQIYVSEWAEVKEYGRRGVASKGHTHLGIHPYPLNHAPAWGNLICVPSERVKELEGAIYGAA